MATAVFTPVERDDPRSARARDATPYDRVMALGYDEDKGLIAIFFVGASIVQASLTMLFLFISLIGLAMFADDVRGHVEMRLAEIEIDVTRDDAPPMPAVEPVVKEITPTVAKDPTPKDAPPQAASPAAAAQALTAKEDPNAPLDLTGNTIVTGSASAYAGGNSSNDGTSTVPVRTIPVASGVPGGTGTGTAPASTVDRSRSAGLLGGNEWNCSSFWPTEAEVAQVDEAVVKIQVSVSAEGLAQTVKILSDPGNGFGGAAIRCAKRQRFRTALDRDGNPQAGNTNPFNVRFNR